MTKLPEQSNAPNTPAMIAHHAFMGAFVEHKEWSHDMIDREPYFPESVFKTDSDIPPTVMGEPMDSMEELRLARQELNQRLKAQERYEAAQPPGGAHLRSSALDNMQHLAGVTTILERSGETATVGVHLERVHADAYRERPQYPYHRITELATLYYGDGALNIAFVPSDDGSVPCAELKACFIDTTAFGWSSDLQKFGDMQTQQGVHAQVDEIERKLAVSFPEHWQTLDDTSVYALTDAITRMQPAQY